MKQEDLSTLVFRCYRHGKHEIKVPVVMEFGAEKIIGYQRPLALNVALKWTHSGLSDYQRHLNI